MWEIDNEREKDGIIYCSFCKKRQDQVNRLIAGVGGLHICIECVDLYREHMEKTTSKGVNMKTIIRVCSTCGTRPPVSHRYCYNCGTKFPQET